MIHYVRLLAKRFATCLSVVAALSFAADVALGTNHHMSAAAGHHHHHGDSHSHGGHSHGHRHHGPASDAHAVDESLAKAVDAATADLDESLASAPDIDSHGFLNACFAAVVLPSPSAHSVPFSFYMTVTAAQPRPGTGVEPDGPRKPPRPLALT